MIIEEQMELFESEDEKSKNVTTFVDNMKLPIHRWFRYSAGFSAEWIELVIQKFNVDNQKNFNVFDPFVGSGTVLLASDKKRVNGMGTESHPFVSKMTKAKLLWDKVEDNDFLNFGMGILEEAKRVQNVDVSKEYSELIYKCYPIEVLNQLTSLKRVIQDKQATGGYLYELSWLALVSILRTCSSAGTAQWQYVLPNRKTKAKLPFDEYENKIKMMASDIHHWKIKTKTSKAIFIQEDARNCPSVESAWADLVITSPPYANNYDYADATRLEMSFFNEVNSWGDLQNTVRSHLIRSCTQHVSKQKKETFEILKSDILKPIYSEIVEVCKKLDLEKENHGGKKNYHTMIALYFLDLAEVWYELRRICKEGANVCFVIGDSAPYGVYVPVDKWLGELALAAGFKEYSFEKVRDRNTKWKNRKHTVPLKEGFLWVKG
ncbi:hypothetical protein [Paenibacillus massiliensis]|uniref:hypothetical protein n=1 Tax=Paenibacillus massiliensis TaxID=225917 RepID=UPI000471F5C9|nr:hypothetical protein [Paenibacillus massiliensis]